MSLMNLFRRETVTDVIGDPTTTLNLNDKTRYDAKVLDEMSTSWKIFSKAMLAISSLSVGIVAMFAMISNIDALQNALSLLGLNVEIEVKQLLVISIILGVAGGYLLERVSVLLAYDLQNEVTSSNLETNGTKQERYISYVFSGIGIVIFIYANAWLFVSAAKNIVTLTAVPPTLLERVNTYKNLAKDETLYIDNAREKMHNLDKLSNEDIRAEYEKLKQEHIDKVSKVYEPIIKKRLDAEKAAKAKLEAWKVRELKKPSNKKDNYRFLNKVYKSKLKDIESKYNINDIKDRYMEELKAFAPYVSTDEVKKMKKESIYADIEEHRERMLKTQGDLTKVQEEIKVRSNSVFTSEAYWFVAFLYILAQLTLEVKIARAFKKKYNLIYDDVSKTNRDDTDVIVENTSELLNVVDSFINHEEKAMKGTKGDDKQEKKEDVINKKPTDLDSRTLAEQSDELMNKLNIDIDDTEDDIKKAS